MMSRSACICTLVRRPPGGGSSSFNLRRGRGGIGRRAGVSCVDMGRFFRF
jgi:hypothetical protein